MNLNEKERYVLDSYAMLCWLNDEIGADVIERLLVKGKEGKIKIFMNWVNIGEVYYIIQRKESLKKAIETISLIKQLPIERIEFDESIVLIAGDYKAKYPIAYADAYCVASAQLNNATLVTGDREFEYIKNNISIEWLPRKK